MVTTDRNKALKTAKKIRAEGYEATVRKTTALKNITVKEDEKVQVVKAIEVPAWIVTRGNIK